MTSPSLATDAPPRVRPIGVDYQHVHPLGGRLLVRLSEVPECTPSGLWLADQSREQYCEGVALAVGRGMPVPGLDEQRAVVQAAVGDRVLFRSSHLTLADDREKIGAVDDRDLLAVIDAAGGVWPCGSWLLLEFFDRVTERVSGLSLPQKRQQRPHRGRIVRYGPGRLRLRGPYMGTRQPIAESWGLPRETALTGAVVCFGRLARCLDVFHKNAPVENWLLAAEDALAIEVED